jgi:hypothetical protein
MLRLLSVAAAVALTVAQVPQGGSPRSFNEAVPGQTSITEAPPKQDIAALIAEDSSNKSRKDEVGGMRVGVLVEVNADLADFTSDALADGTTIHRLAVRSAGALGMGVNFDKFQLPEGAQLFIYSADKSVVRGSFTAWNHKPTGDFAVTPVPGDTLIVEVVVPASAAGEPIAVVVGTVVHHYVGTRLTGSQGATHPAMADARARRGFGDSGACNVNTACPLAARYEKEALGIAMILTGSGSRLCSGSMINNVEQDGKQYFLTADHCGAAGSGATSWIVVFNYATAGCANGATEPSTADSAQGMRLIAANGNSDFGLLEVVERIPPAYNVYLNGFDASDDNSFLEPFSLSHPSGDVRKAAYFGGMAVPEGYFNPGDTHWLIAEWDEGVTEGGSSGSPIFDTLGHIRGQLHGGYAACSYLYVDYYGRLSKSWDFGTGNTNQLATHLDPQRTGTRVVDGGSLSAIQAAYAAKPLNKGTIAH